MKKITVAVLLFLFFGFLKAEVPAADSPVLISVQSEFAHDTSGNNRKKWKIRLKKREAYTKIDIFSEGSDSPVCSLRENNSGEVAWEGEKPGTSFFSDGPFFINPGLSAPCNFLPDSAEDHEQPIAYRFVRTAAGQKFLDVFTVKFKTVTKEEAEAKGWLKIDAEQNNIFTVKEVFDNRNRMILRQVWPAFSPWWVYEETLYGKSWMVEQ